MEKENFINSHQFWLYNEERTKLRNRLIPNLVKECKLNANKHGWFIIWNIENIIHKDEDIKVLSIGDTIALCHSELSEALESFRDNDLEHFKEEIADEFIRLFHLCGDLNINIEEEINKKMEKNKSRPKNHGRINY